MDGTAVHIQNDIVTIVFVLVYHVRQFLSNTKHRISSDLNIAACPSQF